MIDDLIRRRLREVLDVEPPDPTLRARIMASLPLDSGDERPGRRWLAGALARLLAVSVVTALLYARSIRDSGPQTGGGHIRPANLVAIGSAQVVSPTDLRCQLPLATGRAGVFLSLPDGKLSLDPANTSDTGLTRPHYAGGRWLAVAPQMAPDGSAYAYASAQKLLTAPYMVSALHVVDTASGKDRVVWSGEGGLSVAGFGSGVVYANLTDFGGDPNRTGNSGLWAFDLKGGAPRRVQAADDRTSYTAVRGGGAWALTFSRPAGPAGTKGAAVNGPDTIRRLDLATGSASDWGNIPGGYLAYLAGFDLGGHPLIRLDPPLSSSQGSARPAPGSSRASNPAPSASTLFLVPAQDRFVEVTSDPVLSQATPVADRYGIWLAGRDGSIWLYDPAAGLRKIAQIDPGLLAAAPAVPGKAGSVPQPDTGLKAVAGACT